MVRGPVHSKRSVRPKRRNGLALLLTLLVAPGASACTLCHSADARELRHQVFEHGLMENLLSISLVFPILLGAIYLAGVERAERQPLGRE